MGWQSPNFRISAPRSHARCPMATPTLEAGACWSLLKHYPTEWKIFYQNTTFSTQISGINLILCAGLVAGPLGCVPRPRMGMSRRSSRVTTTGDSAQFAAYWSAILGMLQTFLAGIQHFWQYIFGRNSTFLAIHFHRRIAPGHHVTQAREWAGAVRAKLTFCQV